MYLKPMGHLCSLHDIDICNTHTPLLLFSSHVKDSNSRETHFSFDFGGDHHSLLFETHITPLHSHLYLRCFCHVVK